MEDGRNLEPKVTSVEQFELYRAATAKEAEKEKLTEFFKTKRALLHSGYETCSPEAQECDRKVLDVKVDKVNEREREAKLLERHAHANSNQPPNSNQPQKQQSQGIER